VEEREKDSALYPYNCGEKKKKERRGSVVVLVSEICGKAIRAFKEKKGGSDGTSGSRPYLRHEQRKKRKGKEDTRNPKTRPKKKESGPFLGGKKGFSLAAP